MREDGKVFRCRVRGSSGFLLLIIRILCAIVHFFEKKDLEQRRKMRGGQWPKTNPNPYPHMIQKSLTWGRAVGSWGDRR